MSSLLAPTALAFYRHRQNLTDFDKERPKNLNSIYKAVLDKIDVLKDNLDDIELEFFDGRRVDIYLRTLVQHLKRLQKQTNVNNLNAAWQVDDIATKIAANPGEDFQNNILSMKVLREYHNKLLQFVPDKFESVLEDIGHILSFLSRYCLSFYTENYDSYLETAQHYNKKQTEFNNAIKDHIENVTSMSKSYRSHLGLQADQFGLTSNDYARRIDCGELSIVLVIPQALANLRNALKGIKLWIEADREYATYIKQDITDLEGKLQDQLKIVEQSRRRYFHSDVLFKRATKDFEQQKQEMSKTKEKEIKLTKEYEELLSEHRFLRMDIDLLRERIDDVKNEEAAIEKVEKLTSEKLQLINQIPLLDKKFERNKKKMYYITERKKLVELKNDEYKRAKKSFDLAKSEYERDDFELNRIQNCLASLKNIYIFKTNAASLKKIFHNMPVTNRKIYKAQSHIQPKIIPHITTKEESIGKQPKAKGYQFDKYLKFVAKLLQQDWIRLYRVLPFFPPRGETTIESDIDKINQEYYRNLVEYQALESLRLWRRVHSRASLHALKSSLIEINKENIAQQIDEKIEDMKKRKMLREDAKSNWANIKLKTLFVGKLKTI
ncbi:DgyrCDS13259 [Dimorphilus gyrociliatus]|uniref:DgyrCDS13259 n=1 Tax=Dimorphilus gyrociliatus TaxID=2664684 RepID=A0A7I8WA52_9ANNE|nr:DgyrCDS13259 [Dimorphilus gyrociliatus]